eukprot:SAG25_NODE_9591_length_366_cov_1.018727_1_plen_32_part_01
MPYAAGYRVHVPGYLLLLARAPTSYMIVAAAG